MTISKLINFSGAQFYRLQNGDYTLIRKEAGRIRAVTRQRSLESDRMVWHRVKTRLETSKLQFRIPTAILQKVKADGLRGHLREW